jgi:ketosteroid isomerase-like protein
VIERVEVMGKDGPASAWVIATNVYIKGAQGWRLVVHHASRGTPQEVHEIIETASILH